jgi:hypothetical protein
MNDYIAKPVDERLLYNKIIGLVKKATIIDEQDEINKITRERCIHLEYLTKRTKANPELMMEMISLYLEQTPSLVKEMKKSLYNKDWNLLYGAVHKMIPSFSIMGIDSEFENMAKQVQEFASTQKQVNGISDLVLKLENVCTQACDELKEEFMKLKNQN